MQTTASQSRLLVVCTSPLFSHLMSLFAALDIRPHQSCPQRACYVASSPPCTQVMLRAKALIHNFVGQPHKSNPDAAC